MITIIAGTNRQDSKTEVIAKEYRRFLNDAGIENQLFSLRNLPCNLIREDLYAEHGKELKDVYLKFIDPADKFVFVIPEYNGGFPGILKLFIDCVPPQLFYGKKAGLVGVSAGRAGNLRGTDQFTNVLNYLQVHVLHFKPPLSSVDSLVNDEGTITHEITEKILRDHVEQMKAF